MIFLRIAVLGFLSLWLIYMYLLTLPAAERQKSVPFYQSDSFNVIAHGNGRALLPGNTLEAGVNALSVGADILEMDIHLTADNHLVVRHDDIIDTTTNGTGAIAEMSLAQIQQYDVGFHKIDYPGLVAPSGIMVPTLESIFQKMPSSYYIIELKPEETDPADQLCLLIKQYGLQDQVLVGSFYTSVLEYFRDTCSEVPTSLGQSEVIVMVAMSALGLGHLYSPAGSSVQLPLTYFGIKILTPAILVAAHQMNLRVDIWTVNDTTIMRDLIDMGVDGVITDRPDLLRQLVPL
ncbi:glycerophosphodiester phosphodiesterase [SAR92 clade bacterium H246]